ncbi:MAG: hypothetical protein ACI9F9_002434 [Candidatus Paceibacteria bacterium]|jgi:hypothetical protein
MKLLTALSFLLLLPTVASAQCEITRIAPTAGVMLLGDFQGDRVSVLSGASKLVTFEPINGAWTQTGSYPAPGVGFFNLPTATHWGSNKLFGRDEDGNLDGRAFMVDEQGAMTTFVPSNPIGLYAFGAGVALHDGLAIVGASMVVYDTGWCGPGRSHVYELMGSTWTEVAVFAPHGHGNAATDYGYKIDTDGSTIVCGARWDDEGGGGAGAVYVYAKNNTTGWYESAKLLASDTKPGFQFGSGVAVEGNQILVGAQSAGPHGNGAVYVFERQGAIWVETQILRASNGQFGDSFGIDVDMDRHRAVVGASGVDGAWTNAGAIYMLERDAFGWSESANVVANDVSNNNMMFGHSVRISGNQALWGPSWGTEVRLTSLGIDQVTHFCSSTPNSTGVAATIEVSGCDSIIANAMTLSAMDMPAFKPGFFLYGSNAIQFPIGNGTLCIGSPQRLATLITDAGGMFEMNVDFQSPDASALTPGRTWLFQTFFRDTVGSGFDFSNALELELQY